MAVVPREGNAVATAIPSFLAVLCLSKPAYQIHEMRIRVVADDPSATPG